MTTSWLGAGRQALVAPARLVCVLAMALSLSACDLNSFRLGGQFDDGGVGSGDGGGGGGGGDAGGGGGDGDGGMNMDGGGGCTPAPEICDGADNDCDGDIDEDFNLEADPANCGSCGFACDRPNSSGSCNMGTCEFECLPGFNDIDQTDPNDGCEYFCIETNGGVEICDLADNNCDGVQDEDEFDLLTDENNCGACGRSCNPLNATPLCDNGTCSYVPGSCAAGFNDINPDVIGCEYACPDGDVGGDELCNGIDDDCDGVVDENVNDPGVGVDCFADNPGGGVYNQGVCGANPGTSICVFGNITCQSPTNPGIEQCDGGSDPNISDEDCDGDIDEGFDLDNDVNNCGACGNQCSFDNALAGCDGSGNCEIVACQAGFVDDPDQGGADCDYECTITGAEVCDGVDNDCDKLVDAADSDTFANGGMYQPPNFCSQLGACNGATVVCGTETDDGVTPDCDTTTITYRCDYPSAAETLCGGSRIVQQETLCDGDGNIANTGADGDCDVNVDETFTDLGDYCDDSVANGGTEVGACISSGNLVCNVAEDGTTCDFSNPGTGASPGDPDPCDGIDNDCDSSTDEDPEDAANIVAFASPPSGITPFQMYKYEAARPDATGGDQGLSTARSCSKPDVIPWSNIDWTAAAQACADVPGTWRLCTEDEWKLSCAGPPTGTCAVQGDDCSGGICNDDLATGICDDTSGANAGLACEGDGDCAGGTCATESFTITPAAGQFRCIRGSTANEFQPCTDDDDCDGGGSCSPGEGDCDGHCQELVGYCAKDSDAREFQVCADDVDCDSGTVCQSEEVDCEGKCGPLLQYRCAAGSETNEGGACTTDDDCDSGGDCTAGEADCEGKCGPIGQCTQRYPYGNTYDPFACNGFDYDVDFNTTTCELNDNVNEVLPTSSLYGCEAGVSHSDTTCESTSSGVIDLSGNLREWTSTVVDTTNARVLGGAYDNEAESLTCDFDFLVLDQGFALDNLGFRCCKDL